MLRLGPDTGPVVVAALPLFEEANRTRAFTVAVLRTLAQHDIGGALPDLPGQGESLIPTDAASLADLRGGFTAAADQCGARVFSFAIRSGALLDSDAALAGRYHLAPATGVDLRRELVRARQASARDSGEPFDPATIETGDAPVELAGNMVAPDLLRELSGAMPTASRTRTIRLETDARPADAKLSGSPLWRRAEPDNDIEFAARVADDIAAWIATCVD